MFLQLIIASYMLIKWGLRMLDFKGWMLIPNAGNLCHLLAKVPFCSELPSPLPPAHLDGGDGRVWLLLLGAMGRRDATRVASVCGD